MNAGCTLLWDSETLAHARARTRAGHTQQQSPQTPSRGDAGVRGGLTPARPSLADSDLGQRRSPRHPLGGGEC